MSCGHGLAGESRFCWIVVWFAKYPHAPSCAKPSVHSGLSKFHKTISMHESILGGPFTFPGTRMTVQRMGYGAMQLAGPGVWGPPNDLKNA
jgi:hypothetical protein